MPRSSVILRSLAVAGFGLCAVPAFGQSTNVTAFNPYGSGGGSVAAPVYAMPQGAPGGMAFNPWNPGAASGVAYTGRGDVEAPYAMGTYSRGSSNSGSYLPAPPPGPIESRLTAVPQLGDRTPRAAPMAPPPSTPAPATPTPSAATPEPTVTPAAPPPAPPPAVVTVAPAAPQTPAPTPAPPTPVVAPPPPPPAVASVTPPPPEPPAAPAPAAVMASVTFTPQSAEISPAARTELDRVAQSVKGGRGIELRAYASGGDPTEARKVALARALAVRSYLIDQNVKTRIEVGAFASSPGGSERVEVLAP
jgi:outer membrane protein OmpA-like peptidoglycan-associated protein